MRQRKKPFLLLLIALSSCIGLGITFFLFSPTEQFIFFNLPIPTLAVFLSLIFVFFYSLGTLVLKSKLQGLIIGIFVISFLLFRLNNLTHPFFFILLAALFLTVELFAYRK